MTDPPPSPRTRHGRGARTLTVPVALAAVVALAACGDADAPDVPDDFTTTELETLEVSHPQGWEPQQVESLGEEEEDPKMQDIVYVDPDEGREVAVISLVHRLSFTGRMEQGVAAAVQGRSEDLPEYSDEREEAFNTGGEEAYRVDFSYTDVDGEATGEMGAEFQGVDIVMLSETEHYAHQATVSWELEHLDSEIAEDIVETIYLNE